ncbi:putative Telomere repeat-binding zinc finger protein [Balamuthia mandrillaris]
MQKSCFVVVALVLLCICFAAASSKNKNNDKILSRPAYRKTAEELQHTHDLRDARMELLEKIGAIGPDAKKGPFYYGSKHRKENEQTVHHVEKEIHTTKQHFSRENRITVFSRQSALLDLNSLPTVVDLDMLPSRDPSLDEQRVARSIAHWITQWRFGHDAQVFIDGSVGLRAMALNVSQDAANEYDGFDTNPLLTNGYWAGKAICDLDFSQKDPDMHGTIFEFPNWCVQDIIAAGLFGAGPTEMISTLKRFYEDTIIQNRFQQVAIGCASPDSSIFTATYDYYCFVFFVHLTDQISEGNCACSSLVCCPDELDITYETLVPVGEDDFNNLGPFPTEVEEPYADYSLDDELFTFFPEDGDDGFDGGDGGDGGDGDDESDPTEGVIEEGTEDFP